MIKPSIQVLCEATHASYDRDWTYAKKLGKATARKEHSRRSGPVLRGSMALPFTVTTGQSKVSALLQETVM